MMVMVRALPGKKKNQQGREQERGTDCSYLDRVN